MQVSFNAPVMHNKIHLIKGDITQQQADAIVNAANSSLLGGGGVDGAIHRAGGPEILKQCIEIRNRQGGCKTGEAVITGGGNLKAKYVIHTVGPVWNGGDKGEPLLLANAYRNSLKLAMENGIHTIAFPNISTGIYHFPKDLAARIATDTVKSFLNDEGVVLSVTFVCFDDENYDLYQSLLKEK